MPSPALLVKSIEDFVSNNRLIDDVKELFTTCSAGFVGFTSAMTVSTCTQRYIGISTGSLPPFPSLFGLLSVCMAATISHQLASSAQHYYHTHNWHKRNNNVLQGFQFPVKDSSKTILRLGSLPITMQTLKVCAIGILTFRLLGGRFWAVAPSSYTHLGSFARRSLPATESYASRVQRIRIEQLGRWWGCHTCGSKGWLPRSTCNFVGDHMPPKSVAAQMNRRWWRRILRRPVQYRFYPQCITCSSKQGSLLSAGTSQKVQRLASVGGGKDAHMHGLRPRIYHGTGIALGILTMVDPNLIRIERWSKRHLHSWSKVWK